jgi:hypothetical protein
MLGAPGGTAPLASRVVVMKPGFDRFDPNELAHHKIENNDNNLHPEKPVITCHIHHLHGTDSDLL